MTRNCLNVMRKVASGDIRWPNVPNFDGEFKSVYLSALGDKSQKRRDEPSVWLRNRLGVGPIHTFK